MTKNVIYNSKLSSLNIFKPTVLFSTDDFLTCPCDRSQKISISQIAPDLVLVDLPQNIILDVNQLELEQSSDFLLGKMYIFAIIFIEL